MSNAPQLVQKLWNYCNILRDDGLSFRLRMATTRHDGDYVEQLTFLLFGSLAPARSGVARSLRERRLAATLAARLLKMAEEQTLLRHTTGYGGARPADDDANEEAA